MSRFLLLNFEDFGLNQDIIKIKQPLNPFCICCLNRDGPMFDLEKCDHSDYLDVFSKPELKQFNQLVCLQCHSLLKKIKCFQAQVIESYSILLSGEFTNTTVNGKKLNKLFIQKVVADLHLPPDIEASKDSIDEDTGNIQKYFSIVQNGSNMEQNFTHSITEVVQNYSTMEQNFSHDMVEVQIASNMGQNLTHNMADIVQNNSNIEQNFTHNMSEVQIDSNMEHKMADIVQNDSNIEQNFVHNMAEVVQNDSNIEQNFNHNMTDIQNHSNVEPFTNIDENLIQEQSRLNKNIKTALAILERNNQSFVSLSSQLQFLNGEHLSYLGPSLLSKEILTDIPLVPAKSLSTDLENGLLNNSKLEIELDGTDKMFYDSMDLSPELMRKEANASEIIEETADLTQIQRDSEPKIKSSATKLKKVKVQKANSLQMIRRVKLSHEELDRERVMQAQSDAYLRYKFRCVTCIVGFNYKENLEDHIKRKHGPREGDSVICNICSQLIHNAGSVTEHNYRHYTRYECIQCKKRYHTNDEAIRHYVKHQVLNSTKKALKNKPSVQLKRVKLKIKPCKS